MASYAQDKIFLQRILETMQKTRDELEVRMDELDDQISYVTHAIDALSVYEHVNPVSKEVDNA